ncbi:MAG: hypothetical protein ACR2HR_02630 [Euzebya sp.]
MSTLDDRVVAPVLDTAAAEVARLINVARAALLRSGSAVTIDMLADGRDSSAAAARQWLTRRRAEGRLVTVPHNGAVLVPTFQLDAAFGLNEAAADVVKRLLGYEMDGWAIWDWAVTPNAWLDGRTPAEMLAEGRTDPVGRAVAGLFQE